MVLHRVPTHWLDARIGATIFALGAYCFHPKATFPARLGWIDCTMLAFVCVNLISDIENTGWQWILPVRIYGEWCMPYIAGRFALTQLDNYKFFAKLAFVVGIVLAGGAIFEGVTGIHPWEILYGERDYNDIDRYAVRWGLTRAWGCCYHPIIFGIVQLMLLPWLLNYCFREVTVQSLVRSLPIIALVFAGQIATGSRATLLATPFVLALTIFVLVPKSRWIFGAILGLTIVVCIFQRQAVLEYVHRWGGQSIEKNKTGTVIVDDQVVELTGTLNRVYLLQVFRRAVYRAGWIGFGTESTTGFPVKVPVGPSDESALRKIKIIDNQYLLLALRFGWLGVILFTAGICLSVGAWYQRGRQQRGADRRFCVYMGSTITGVAIVLLTVWMPQDIGYPLLWMMGAGSAWG